MTPAAPRCPDTSWHTANLAKRAAWWREADRSKRMVPVPCEEHGWHLAAPDVAPDPRRMAGADTKLDERN